MFFENGDLTELVEDRMWELCGVAGLEDDDDAYEIDSIVTFLNEIASEKKFYQGLKLFAEKKGYQEEESEPNGLSKYIIQLFKDNGVTKTKDSKEVTFVDRHTINNWIQKSAPSDSLQSRDNVFAMCFALDLNLDDTVEFFLKYYLVIPFDFRRVEECVYYYCLNNRLPFKTALELIENVKDKLQLCPDTDESENDEFTKIALQEMSSLKNEEDFLRFIDNNMTYFNKINKVAIEKTIEAYERCRKLIYEDSEACRMIYERRHPNNTDGKVELDEEDIYVKDVLEYIYFGGNYDSIKDPCFSSMPHKIRLNIPDQVRVGNILKMKNKSRNSDVIRRALILFKFFDIYKSNTIIGEGCSIDYDDFVSEMNASLANCGYVQLYPRNPYDCLFLLSAKQEDPLYSFQLIINEYVELSLEEK